MKNQKYPVTGEAIRVLGILIDEHLGTMDKYTEDTMHIFNAKLTNLTLQLHGLIPFERVEVTEITLMDDNVQENKWLAFFWTHVSNKRIAKVILHDSLKLVHNPNGKENKHPQHKDWLRFSIYSVTQEDAFRVYNANREVFLDLQFDHITIKGSRMEPTTQQTEERKSKLPTIHWPENEVATPKQQNQPMLEVINIKDIEQHLSEV